MLSFNAYGEWVYINKNQDTGNSFYIETFTIEVDDGTVLWWDLNDYSEPQEDGMLSSALKRAGDCYNKAFVNLGFKWFKNPMATGENSGTFKPEHDWTKPVSGSIEEMMLNFACDYVGLPAPEFMTVISIDKDGKYYINSPFAEVNDMTSVSLNLIINQMYARHQFFPERKVFINAHNDVAYEYVGQVINALIQIEGLEIDFLTQSHSREFSIKTKLAEQDALEAKAKKIMAEASKQNQKIAEQEALKAKAKKIMAIVQRKAEEAKTKEAEILASKANEIIADAETKTKIEEAKAKKAEVKRMTEEAKTKEAEILVQEAAKKIELAEAKRIAEELKLKVAEAKRIALEIEIIKAEVKQSTVEAKTKEAELLVKEVEKQLEEHKQNKAILEQEIAALKLAEEEIQYIRLLIQEVQEEQDAVKSIILEDRLSKLKTAYIMNIAARIKTFWRYQGAEDDWTCEVYVIQDRQGQVNAVDVRNCNGGNSSLAKSFMNSIERAVYKASPLPAAPDESVFDSELYMLFSVN